MLTPPADIDAADLQVALQAGWEFGAVSVNYRPVGFGSHHWLAVSADGARLFVTVDDLDAKLHGAQDSADRVYARLNSAFRTAFALRSRAGLGFVVAPLPDAHGQVLHRVHDRYSMVVHPFVVGRQAGPDGEFRTAADRYAALRLVIALHGTSSATVRTDDFVVPGRDKLERLLDNTAARWDSGPYAEPASALLRSHSGGVARLLAGYDLLADRAAARPERMVVTHGEPNAANVLRTAGGMVLVDWESVLLAPPERDLWHFGAQDQSVLIRYAAATGVEIDHAVLATYRLWYDLFEIAGYLRLFHAPHVASADTAESWRNLVHFLRPAERWPELAG